MPDLAFDEGGHRVPVQEFDYAAFDVEIIQGAYERGRRDARGELYQALWQILDAIAASKKPHMVIEATKFAGELTEKSAMALAAKHGVSKALFSHHYRKMRQLLGLPPARAMKSTKAKLSYAKLSHA